MKTFKIIDVWTSIGLIISFMALIIYDAREFDVMNNLIFTGYFVVGGWQVISMLVHAITRTFNYGARYVYHWITLIAVATMPVGSFWILLFAAPFMALYYTWICWREVYIKIKRPLEMLK
jgi:hypothetical protein